MQKAKCVRSQRGAVAALCEAVIDKAVDDVVYGVGKNREEAVSFLTNERDFGFYAQMASEDCLKKADETRVKILEVTPYGAKNIDSLE